MGTTVLGLRGRRCAVFPVRAEVGGGGVAALVVTWKTPAVVSSSWVREGWRAGLRVVLAAEDSSRCVSEGWRGAGRVAVAVGRVMSEIGVGVAGEIASDRVKMVAW